MSPAAGLVLLDTSLLVHLLRATALGARAERPLISIVTVGEALAFAKKRDWGAAKVTKLRELMEQLVIVDIHSTEILDQYATLDAFCAARGRALGKNDLWIAATAVATDALLLTADRDFDPLHEEGLLRRDWYDPAPAP